jgi:hypothetical protein
VVPITVSAAPGGQQDREADNSGLGAKNNDEPRLPTPDMKWIHPSFYETLWEAIPLFDERSVKVAMALQS